MGLSPNLEPMGSGWKSEPKSKGYQCNNCTHVISINEMNKQVKEGHVVCPNCGNNSTFKKT